MKDISNIKEHWQPNIKRQCCIYRAFAPRFLVRPSNIKHFVNRVFVCIGAENTISKVSNNRKTSIEQIQFERILIGKYKTNNTNRKIQFGKHNSEKTVQRNRKIYVSKNVNCKFTNGTCSSNQYTSANTNRKNKRRSESINLQK